MANPIIAKKFKIGDKIVVTPSFGKVHTYTITRVTKTMAIAEFKNSAGTKCSERFGIEYRVENGTWYYIVRYPREAFTWDRNNYKVVEA